MKIVVNEIKQIGEILKNRNQKVAVAESVTAGALQLLLSQMDLASTIFVGGITVYDAQHKIRILKVKEKDTSVDNCVSESITQQMALHLNQVYEADWCIATTGYATPVQDCTQLHAFYCIVFRGEIQKASKIEISHNNTPFKIQLYYANEIMHQFLQILTSKG